VSESSLVLLREVAIGLDGLLDRIVFIGGAIAPLLQVKPPFGSPRPTGDVDAIAVTVSYSDYSDLCDRLRERGFREMNDHRHAHRWVAPGPREVLFDLVPVGDHLGASGNPWDTAAIETAGEYELEPGLVIRHASAPGFLALKFAAFRDRGLDDPQRSTDLEDIFALMASRPGIIDEVRASPAAVREFVAEQASALRLREDIDDLLAGHLGNVARYRAAEVIISTEQRLQRLAEDA
jgi:hypothetical protein